MLREIVRNIGNKKKNRPDPNKLGLVAWFIRRMEDTRSHPMTAQCFGVEGCLEKAPLPRIPPQGILPVGQGLDYQDRRKAVRTEPQGKGWAAQKT